MCGDARNWDEDAYRESILKEREIQTRTVFRTVWAPAQNPNPNPETIVAASSDGSIASYSISSCISKLVSSLYLLYFFCVSSFLSHPIKICIEFNWHFIFLFSLSDFVCFDRKRSPENDSISASNSEKLVRTHLLLFGLHKKLLIFLDIPNNYV